MVKLIFELVMKEIAKLEAEQACGACAPDCGADSARMEISKKVLAESDVRLAHRNGACEILVSRKAIVTCLAAEYAKRQGITITRKA